MQALAYPFERDLAIFPAGPVLLVNALPCPGPWDPSNTTIWQYWKGAVGAFAEKGFTILSDAPQGSGGKYAGVFLRLPRQREDARFMMDSAWAVLEPGGLFMVAAANDSGGARLEKDLSPYLPDFQSAVKHKCRIVWCQKGAQNFPDSWLTAGAMQLHPALGLWTQPGLFSWDHVDSATNLLLPHIPSGLTGSVADLGCGAGAIADHVLRTSPLVQKMFCLDADARAVAACSKNMAERHPGRNVVCDWVDLSRDYKTDPVDVVVMNPPFHAEKMQAIALGQSFIKNAGAMLCPDGSLFMVANAHLPYEDMLGQNFQSCDKLHEGQGFKIFHAKR